MGYFTVVLCKPLLYGIGELTPRLAKLGMQSLWVTLLCLGGLLVAGALGQVLSSTFYAIGDTRSPTRIGMIGFSVGIVLKISGFLFAGIQGIALGTSAYSILNVFLLRRKLARVLNR